VIEALKVAFVHVRLTKDELDTRAGQALSAQTRADLAALTADIPVVPSAPAAGRWPGRPPSQAAAWSSRSPWCCSPPMSSIRMASAIPIIPGAAFVLSWPLAS
jgi:Domain of unknown function (DUF1707)